jgi:hypothetical protein
VQLELLTMARGGGGGGIAKNELEDIEVAVPV